MEELSLHVLDLAENSVRAGARRVLIRLRESRREDTLSIEIADDGTGMREETLRRALDPFFTTKETRRVGLGLSLFEQAARRAGGEFKLESRPGAGTKVTGVFRRSHVDRQPLGDLAGTLLALIVGNPEVEFSFEQSTDESEMSFSTASIRAQIGDAPINSAEGIAAVRRNLEELKQAARSGP